VADIDFSRQVLYPLERPLADDLNQNATYADQEVRDLAGLQANTRTSNGSDLALMVPVSGFYGSSFKVYPNQVAANGFVYINPGTGLQYLPGTTPSAINGVIGLDDPSAFKPLILTSNASEWGAGIAVPAAPGGTNGRVDIIEVRANMLVNNPSSRDVLQPVSGAFAPQVLNKTLQWPLDNTTAFIGPTDTATTAIAYKTGTVGVPASSTNPTGLTVPPTDPGYIKLAQIFVYGTNTTFGADLITDSRGLLLDNGTLCVSGSGTIVGDGANVQATVVSAAAPPGVSVGCIGNLASTDATASFLVFAGEGEFWGPDSSYQGGVSANVRSATGITIPTTVAASSAVLSLSSPVQQLLQNALVTGTQLKVAVNSGYIALSFAFLDSSGSLITLGAGNTINFNFTFMIQRMM